MKDSSKKECVLIIDQETGEITIERLTKQIAVKKTRPERPEQGGNRSSSHLPPNPGSRPSTPLDQMLRKGGSNRSSPNNPGSRHGSRANSPAPNAVILVQFGNTLFFLLKFEKCALRKFKKMLQFFLHYWE